MPTRVQPHQFVYTSEATAAMTVEELQLLLRQARTFNHAHRLTGLLLYSDGAGEMSTGSFLQILEGNEVTIRTLVARIRLDPRNTRFQVLADGPAAQRMFPDWAMGFVAVVPPDLSRLLGYVDPRRPSYLLPRANTMAPELRQLLRDILAEYTVWPHFLD